MPVIPHRFIALLLLVSAVIQPSSVQANGAETMIVLDGSGSMWGQINGRDKMSIARESLSEIMADMPAASALGLMAYGHRYEGRCDDIELLVPVGPENHRAIQEAVEQVTPRGKTPLTAAIRQAAGALRYADAPATVVVITDGIETCNQDPCALAEDLEQTGVAFTAHVVGFGLSAEQGKQVSCIADATGGRYISAGNAADLRDALDQVVKKPVPVDPVEIPEATLGEPTSAITIGAAFSIPWQGPGDAEDYVDIVNVGQEKTYGELNYAWARDGSPATLKAPGKPGDYDVRYVWQGPAQRHVIARTTVTVGDSAVAIVAPATVSAGESIPVEWTGPGGQEDYIDLVERGATRTHGELSYAYTRNGPKLTLSAPPQAGEYDIRYILQAPDGRQILHTVPLTISTASVSVAAPTVVTAGSQFSVFWEGPGDDDDYVDLVPQGYTQTSGEITYFYTRDVSENATLTAPVEPGDYELRYVMEAAHQRLVMAVHALTVEAAQASLEIPQQVAPGEVFAVTWSGPATIDDYVDLVPQGYTELRGELSYFYTRAPAVKHVLTAPQQPGNYTVRYILEANRQRKVLAEQPIRVVQ